MLLLIASPAFAPMPSGHDHTAAPISPPAWTQVMVHGAHPPGTIGGSMAYDAADGYVVLFGGENLTSGGHYVLTNSTWTYHAGVWIKLRPMLAPSAREYASMVYDLAGRSVLLFGGDGNATSPLYLNDTWTFHHGRWTHVRHSGAPPARFGAAIAYDPAISAAVMGGGVGKIGSNTSGNETDEWEFANGSWTRYAGTEPFNGQGASLGYGPAGRNLVYFGPCGTPTTAVFHLGSWSSLSLGAPTRPGGICYAPFAYDPKLSTLVLFEIQNGGSATWGYHGGWTNLTPTTQPGLRLDPVATYDAADGYFVLFGGHTTWSGRGVQLLHDTWELS
ncbi:MAG: hypothetical protein L3K08_02380 [Thermoplasmata archaeon]|nr:hypothetical protein [Thermoplasmata archaeon]